MIKTTRSQQTAFTKSVITKAKKMLDNKEDYKKVLEFVKAEFDKEAKANGYFDNLQYNKATKSVIEYI